MCENYSTNYEKFGLQNATNVLGSLCPDPLEELTACTEFWKTSHKNVAWESCACG